MTEIRFIPQQVEECRRVLWRGGVEMKEEFLKKKCVVDSGEIVQSVL